MFRKLLQLVLGVGMASVAWFLLSGEASAAPAKSNKQAPASTTTCVDPAAVTGVSYTNQNGTTLAVTSGQIHGVQPGDTITVRFSVIGTGTCPNGVQLSVASYQAQNPYYAPGAAQQLYSSTTKSFAVGGPYTMTIQVPLTSSTANDSECNPQHDNSNGGGANQSPGPYDPSGCSLPSGNGKSTDNNSSKPCAGCVGNADAKNPPGQYPNGGDPNSGYECDKNEGVGQTNPSHTGCGGAPGFQIDFVSGGVITDFSNTSYTAQGRLIGYANG